MHRRRLAITGDDDSGAGLDSQLTYTPTSSGRYYLAAGEAFDSATGTYRLSAATVPPPPPPAADDYAGSTAGMSRYVETHKPARVVLLTECSMSDNVAVRHPELEFVRPCNLCPHMQRITLGNIRAALEHNRHEVVLDPITAGRARLAVERMLAV